MSLLSRFLPTKSRTTTADAAVTKAATVDIPPLPWRADATLPIPDWLAIQSPESEDPLVLQAFWGGAARAWLEALAPALGPQFAIAESAEFMLLGVLAERERQVALEYAERTRRRVLGVLPGIARDDGYGKTVILVLDSAERYYEYVSHYYGASSEHGEFALSGGMFIDHGYGHFVFVADEFHRMEPVIAHELTHCMVRHLPLPAWINEGIAVNTEHRLCPPQGSHYSIREMREKHLAFWNENTIQEFWSGKSWKRPDDGNPLSYELAKTFVTLAARDWDPFVGFVNAADGADSGEAAALEHLRYPLAHLVEAVLGESNWAPNPARWNEGVEHGQF